MRSLFIFLVILVISFIYSCKKDIEDPPNTVFERDTINYKLLDHEILDRGVVAVALEGGNKRYISWRLLADDPMNTGFNVYRKVDDGPEEIINDDPVTTGTNFVDEKLIAGDEFLYYVKPVIEGKEGKASLPFIYNNNKPYFSFRLNDNYKFSKAAVADLNGDGDYDFVLKSPRSTVDPYHTFWKPSSETFKLEAYLNNGEYLWTYDMGWAIEQGVWYSPYIVYDLNSDGKAEVILKSGEGDPRDDKGKVQNGSEYLTVLNGITGNIMAQTDWIPRTPWYEYYLNNPGWAYSRASRNQMGIAYLDGVHPHLIVVRGTYSIIIVRAYRLLGNQLEQVWEWDNRKAPESYRGAGGHTFTSADVDGDGRDEIIIGTCALDNDGTELWATGLKHNDHGYLGEIDPDRPGLEIYYGIETKSKRNGMCLVDAKSGDIIWGINEPTNHVHSQGLCSDIDKNHRGAECYSGDVDGSRNINFTILHNSKGEEISRNPIGGLVPRALYWDADKQRELLIARMIFDYQGSHTHHDNVEGDIIAIGDFFGDWREEIITSLYGELRIYTSTIPADSRYPCLMQDPLYRNNIAHTSMGYSFVPMTTHLLDLKKYSYEIKN